MEVLFTPSALAEYHWWEKHDSRKIVRIQTLCAAIKKKPFQGIGKPEPLKFDLQGCWSRRIDKTHRLVYAVEGRRITVISCRFHY